MCWVADPRPGRVPILAPSGSGRCAACGPRTRPPTWWEVDGNLHGHSSAETSGYLAHSADYADEQAELRERAHRVLTTASFVVTAERDTWFADCSAPVFAWALPPLGRDNAREEGGAGRPAQNVPPPTTGRDWKG